MQKTIRPITVPIILLSFSFSLSGFAEDAARKEEAVNEKCTITGKAVNPKCVTTYEGTTYAFCSGECRRKFQQDRADSLYQKIGGKAAISAAVDLFYTKVLADDRVNDFFEDVNMKRQHNKQKAFFSAALGGPEPWTGKDMRKAHANLDLKVSDFRIIAQHLQTTLEELKVNKDLIEQVMAIIQSTRNDVLNRGKKAE